MPHKLKVLKSFSNIEVIMYMVYELNIQTNLYMYVQRINKVNTHTQKKTY